MSRDPRGRRAWRVGTSATVSALCHAALAVVFLAVWHSMVQDVSAPEPISVEVVKSIPGETAKPEKTEDAAPKPEPPPPPPPQAKADPIAPPAPPEPPKPSALDQALKPELSEPPAEARPAETQSEVNQAGNKSTATGKAATGSAGTPDAPKPPREDAKPVAAPTVLTAGESDTSVPAPASPTEEATPPTAGDPTQAAQQEAQVAAALPMSGLPMPSTFRAALSAFGTSANANYRGSVFGALSRARQAVDDEARAKRLTGQVVLAIVLTDTGAIEKLAVVQSSGHADADAFALAMVRRAAPFPPPPPGASHTFTPAMTFGP